MEKITKVKLNLKAFGKKNGGYLPTLGLGIVLVFLLYGVFLMFISIKEDNDEFYKMQEDHIELIETNIENVIRITEDTEALTGKGEETYSVETKDANFVVVIDENPDSTGNYEFKSNEIKSR